MREEIIFKAEINEKSKKYTFWTGAIALTVMMIGIPLLPIWLLGFGQWYANAYYKKLEVSLTERFVNIKKGVIFKKDKNIPLDRITDVAINEGPLLRLWKIKQINVETAGGQQGNNVGGGIVVGIKDVEGFRNKVLDQRTSLKEGFDKSLKTNEKNLTDVYNMLEKIEKKLK